MSNAVLEKVQERVHHVAEISHEVRESILGRKAEKIRAEQAHLRHYISGLALVGSVGAGIDKENEVITAFRAARMLHSRGIILPTKFIGIRPLVPENELESVHSLQSSGLLLRNAIDSAFPDQKINSVLDPDPIVLETSRNPDKAKALAWKGVMRGIREHEDQIDFLEPPSGVRDLGLIAITNSESDYMTDVFDSFHGSALSYGGVVTLYTVDEANPALNKFNPRYRPSMVEPIHVVD